MAESTRSPRFKRVRSDDLGDVQKEIETFSQELGPFAGARLIASVTIGTVETRVSLGGKTASRWFVVSPRSSATVWQTRDPDGQFLYLIASASVTCALGVF